MSPQETVAAPVARALLEKELRGDLLLRTYEGLEIYCLDGREAPNVMEEIGRIREIEFRRDGAGTGKVRDVDAFDVGKVPYKQIISWDPEALEIVAMYRCLSGAEALATQGSDALATHEVFHFSSSFVDDYLPYTIELGRSVVNREARRKIKGWSAVWCGLGALVCEHPEMRYFFGKLTVSRSYPVEARNWVIAFLSQVLPGREGLVWPRAHLEIRATDIPANAFPRYDSFEQNFVRLRQKLKPLGVAPPPLLKFYFRLNRRTTTFGTALNRAFGDVSETAGLIPKEGMNPDVQRRFVNSHVSLKPRLFLRTRPGP